MTTSRRTRHTTPQVEALENIISLSGVPPATISNGGHTSLVPGPARPRLTSVRPWPHPSQQVLHPQLETPLTLFWSTMYAGDCRMQNATITFFPDGPGEFSSRCTRCKPTLMMSGTSRSMSRTAPASSSSRCQGGMDHICPQAICIFSLRRQLSPDVLAHDSLLLTLITVANFTAVSGDTEKLTPPGDTKTDPPPIHLIRRGYGKFDSDLVNLHGTQADQTDVTGVHLRTTQEDTRMLEIRCRFIFSGKNDELPSREGAPAGSSRIRCRFIFSGKNDEPTPVSGRGATETGCGLR